MKRAWLLALALIPALLWVGAEPGRAAATPVFKVTSIKTVGCADFDWEVNYSMSDNPGEAYVHTVVTAGGLVYMNEQAGAPIDGPGTWGLFTSTTYGPMTGTWPMPAGKPMRAVFTVEKPVGNVVSSWTLAVPSCDSKQILFNGPSSEDADGDNVSVFKDACPAVPGFRANGCPLLPRTLALTPASGPRRVIGKLTASAKAMYAGRTVTVWKVRPGPDLKVGTRTTGALGGFTVPVPSKGQYYAMTPGVLLPKIGQALGRRSTTVVVK